MGPLQKPHFLVLACAFGLSACASATTTPYVQSYEYRPQPVILSAEVTDNVTGKAMTQKVVEPIEAIRSPTPAKAKAPVHKPNLLEKPASVDKPSPPQIESKAPHMRLVYGAEMPLVCKNPVLAKGELKNRPNLQVMWENYLYDRPEGIWGEIGGYVEINGNLPEGQGRWTNACAVRMSHMLIKAGYKIPKMRGKTSSGANKDQYIFRLADMEAYLFKILGQPTIKITDGSGNQFDLPDAPGVVLMDFPNSGFTGHVTIWNGGGAVDGSEIGGHRVLFWPLPCYLPEGREGEKDILISEAPGLSREALP